MAFPAGTVLQNQGILLVVSWRTSAGVIVAVNSIRTITNSLYQFNTLVEAGVIPELSNRFGASDISEVRRIAEYATSIITLGNVVLSGVIAIVGSWFLSVWSHGRVHASIAVVALFAACSATDCVWHSMTIVAQAKNVHQRIALAYLTACVIALPVSYLLLPSLGAAGVACSLFSTSILVNIVAVPSVCHLLQTTVPSYTRNCWMDLRALSSAFSLKIKIGLTTKGP
jgi:O-antigen/teichoic acid export membrane protein